MFFRLKEIVDRDSDIFNGLLSGEVSAQDVRDLTWRGLILKKYRQPHRGSRDH